MKKLTVGCTPFLAAVVATLLVLGVGSLEAQSTNGSAFQKRDVNLQGYLQGTARDQPRSDTKKDRLELEAFFTRNRQPRNMGVWLKLLKDGGFDRVRVRSVKPTDKISIKKRVVLGRQTRIVFARLGDDGILLPGNRRPIRDLEKLKAWTKLQTAPSSTRPAKPVAFGLSAEKLVELHVTLSRPIPKSTVGMTTNDFLQTVARLIPIPLKPSDQAWAILDVEKPVSMELQGVGAGTAIAAFMRPLGLVLVPRTNSKGGIALTILPSSQPKEYWPVGWPAAGIPLKQAPKLFETFTPPPVQSTVKEGLAQIAMKSGVPVLLDFNTLLLRRMNINQKKLVFNGKKMNYRHAIQKWTTFGKKRAVVEIRMDEADRPFVWISGGR